MRKRRIYLALLILAAAGLVVVIVAGAFREREPEYGGKKLSEWVEILGSGNFAGHAPQADDARAFDAIRHIGQSAVPFLLRCIRYERPPWKSKLYWTLNTSLGWRFIDKKEVRANAAVIAFGILHSQQLGKMEELTQVLQDPAAFHAAFRVGIILARKGDAGVPGLMGGLTNQNPDVRRFFAKQIGDTGVRGFPIDSSAVRSAIPALRQLLCDPDSAVRNDATNALRAIDPNALERATR